MSKIKQYLDKVAEYKRPLDFWAEGADKYNKEHREEYLHGVIIILRDNFYEIFSEEIETLKELKELEE